VTPERRCVGPFRLDLWSNYSKTTHCQCFSLTLVELPPPSQQHQFNELFQDNLGKPATERYIKQSGI